VISISVQPKWFRTLQTSSFVVSTKIGISYRKVSGFEKILVDHLSPPRDLAEQSENKEIRSALNWSFFDCCKQSLTRLTHPPSKVFGAPVLAMPFISFCTVHFLAETV
jgi:hypothetical protein